MNLPANPQTPGELLESVIIKGDLAVLTPAQRVEYYNRVCATLGLNTLTQPFEYIVLNGKLRLYAKKDCTDQLRKLNSVSVTDLTQADREGVFIVTAKVEDKTGRKDMATGAVSIASLRGEALANGLMKAETKAKRRATLSICGLGFFDELEVDDIPRAAPRAATNVMLPDDPPQITPRGAVEDPAPASRGAAGAAVSEEESETDRIKRLDRELAAAAEEGWGALKRAWETINNDDAAILNAAMNNRHKPRAIEVERARMEAPR